MLWPNKRGAHLSLSLAGSAFAANRLVRIGVSATQKPIEDVARFLVGAGHCRVPIIDTGMPGGDLAIESSSPSKR